jgi:hypothetical protein
VDNKQIPLLKSDEASIQALLDKQVTIKEAVAEAISLDIERSSEVMPKLDVEKLIAIHIRRLQKLQEQRAMYGSSVDPRVLLEIEDIEKEIARLRSSFET